MADVNRLLDEATPLPWFAHKWYLVVDDTGGPIAEIEDSAANQALIVYAVNRLPDYEAAVDWLERAIEWIAKECWPEADYVGQGHNWSMSQDERDRAIRLLNEARVALARLRSIPSKSGGGATE